MEKNVKAELLVVDDHSLILEGICKIVNKMPEVTVADAVTSGKQAIKLIEERDYDVYILDISIPDISGFELIAKIRELNDQAKIVVNTMHEEIWMVNRLVQCRSKCGYSEIFGSCRTGGSYSQCTEGGELYLSSFCFYIAKVKFFIIRFTTKRCSDTARTRCSGSCSQRNEYT